MKTKELRDKIADLILAEATPEEFVALFQSQLREVLGRVRLEEDEGMLYFNDNSPETARFSDHDVGVWSSDKAVGFNAGFNQAVSDLNKKIDEELKKSDD